MGAKHRGRRIHKTQATWLLCWSQLQKQRLATGAIVLVDILQSGRRNNARETSLTAKPVCRLLEGEVAYDVLYVTSVIHSAVLPISSDFEHLVGFE